MFSIDVNPFEPNAMMLDRAGRALEEEKLKDFEEICLTSICFTFESIRLERKAVSIPLLSLSLFQFMVALSVQGSMGRVYCNNEPCFFFKHDEGVVTFTRYDPADISDTRYQNELTIASTADVLAAVTATVGVLGRTLRRYAGGRMIRPDDQVWGVLSIMNHNPFVC